MRDDGICDDGICDAGEIRDDGDDLHNDGEMRDDGAMICALVERCNAHSSRLEADCEH